MGNKGKSDKFSIDVPTIKAGQSLDINLPIANKLALYVLGPNDTNIHGKLIYFYVLLMMNTLLAYNAK